MKPPNTDESDSVLVKNAKAGDFDAFEELVNRHERRLYSLAMGILHKREDAEDAVQTTFLKALENLLKFREEASFKTWITRIAVNTSLKVLHKRRDSTQVSLDSATTPDESGVIAHPDYIADWKGDPMKIVEDHELKDILDKAADSLQENHRVVFLLRDVGGLSIKETAEALDISEANVKVRLLRARLTLREKLTRIFGDEETRVSSHREDDAAGAATPASEILRSYETE